VNPLDLTASVGQFILRFVQESNEIEDLSVPDRDLLANWQRGRGHMGALREALELAARREPVTLETLCRWQAAVTREQLPYGHWIAEEHIGCLRRLNMRMGRRRPFAAPEDIERSLRALLGEIVAGAYDDPVELAARTHWRFELIHPFVDGNGRTGRLLALHVLRSTGVAPVLFTAGDRASCYFRAFDPAGPEAMIRYFREHQLERDPWLDGGRAP